MTRFILILPAHCTYCADLPLSRQPATGPNGPPDARAKNIMRTSCGLYADIMRDVRRAGWGQPRLPHPLCTMPGAHSFNAKTLAIRSPLPRCACLRRRPRLQPAAALARRAALYEHELPTASPSEATPCSDLARLIVCVMLVQRYCLIWVRTTKCPHPTLTHTHTNTDHICIHRLM